MEAEFLLVPKYGDLIEDECTAPFRLASVIDFKGTEEIFALLDGVEDRLHSLPLAITDHESFDVIYCVLLHQDQFPEYPSSIKQHLLEILCSGLASLHTHLLSHLRKKETPSEGDLRSSDITMRSALRMYLFLLGRFCELASAQAANSTSAPVEKSGSRRKASAQNTDDLWDWAEEACRVVDTLAEVMETPGLERLWGLSPKVDRHHCLPFPDDDDGQADEGDDDEKPSRHAPGEDGAPDRADSPAPADDGNAPEDTGAVQTEELVQRVMEVARGCLVSPTLMKKKKLRYASFHLVGLLHRMYPQAVGGLVAVLVHLLEGCEHAPGAIAEMCQAAPAAAGGPPATNPALKQLASFLVEVFTRLPHELAARLWLVLPLLDGEAHLVRSAVCEVAAQVVLWSARAEAGAKPSGPSAAATAVPLVPLRDHLLARILERLLDTSAFTRIRALNMVALLASDGALPRVRYSEAALGCAGRLGDVASTVRRAALGCAATLLERNPYGPLLSARAFRVQLDQLPPTGPQAAPTSTAPLTAAATGEVPPPSGEPTLPKGDVPADPRRRFLEAAAAFGELLNSEWMPRLMMLLRSKAPTDGCGALKVIVQARRFGVDAVDAEALQAVAETVWSSDVSIRDGCLDAHRILMSLPLRPRDEAAPAPPAPPTSALGRRLALAAVQGMLTLCKRLSPAHAALVGVRFCVCFLAPPAWIDLLSDSSALSKSFAEILQENGTAWPPLGHPLHPLHTLASLSEVCILLARAGDIHEGMVDALWTLASGWAAPTPSGGPADGKLRDVGVLGCVSIEP
ncbi:putative Condensin complex; subunit 1; N-terminal [Paratrimastix pyriformis]|uniref:Condensin complex n=1 Tax=Paratrimastix pyriformis TaxID=342808 RepID=A0ABQ8UBK9_9EUKA|nr:putative Condensin complex; subunit 1; N-terminal [Paratrimastix pyriformis]